MRFEKFAAAVAFGAALEKTDTMLRAGLAAGSMALALAVAGSASAAPIFAYDFAGTITSSDSGITVAGQTFSGHFSYDDSPSPYQMFSGSGWTNYQYAALTSFSIETSDGAQISYADSNGKLVQVQNGTSGSGVDDVFQVFAGNARSLISGPVAGGWTPFSASVYFIDPSNAAFGSSSLPQVLNFADFSSGGITLAYTADGGNRLGFVQGTVTSLTAAAVPEPATWALMILGVAGIGVGVRARRNAARFA